MKNLYKIDIHTESSHTLYAMGKDEKEAGEYVDKYIKKHGLTRGLSLMHAGYNGQGDEIKRTITIVKKGEADAN